MLLVEHTENQQPSADEGRRRPPRKTPLIVLWRLKQKQQQQRQQAPSPVKGAPQLQALAADSPSPYPNGVLTPLSVYSHTTSLSVHSNPMMIVDEEAPPPPRPPTQVEKNSNVALVILNPPAPQINRCAIKVTELADNIVRLVCRGSAETQLAGELASDLRMSVKALLTTAQFLLDHTRQNVILPQLFNFTNNNKNSFHATINLQSPLSAVVLHVHLIKDICRLYQQTPPAFMPEDAVVFLEILIASVLRAV